MLRFRFSCRLWSISERIYWGNASLLVSTHSKIFVGLQNSQILIPFCWLRWTCVSSWIFSSDVFGRALSPVPLYTAGKYAFELSVSGKEDFWGKRMWWKLMRRGLIEQLFTNSNPMQWIVCDTQLSPTVAANGAIETCIRCWFFVHYLENKSTSW